MIKCDDLNIIYSVSENIAHASVMDQQPVDAVAKKPKGSRNVVLLKNDDYRRKKGKVYIPNTIEMAQIKKPHRGQFKKNVQFFKNMDEDMVKQQLQEAFPTFDLKNGRFVNF